MCAVCGLPSTHSNLTQALGWATLFSFTLTTFLGAWWIVTTLNIKNRYRAFKEKKNRRNATVQTVENKG